MPIKAVQQFMLGTVLSNENEARQTLAAMKAAGYDGIELCGFMIHPIGFMVRLLTKAAGMPVGKGGSLDWHALVKEAGLQVVSLHTDLGSLERDAKQFVAYLYSDEACKLFAESGAIQPVLGHRRQSGRRQQDRKSVV